MSELVHKAMALCIGVSAVGYSYVANSDSQVLHDIVSIRYMIDDVPAAVEFYTTRLGFTVEYDAGAAFASVSRDGVRLLLSGNTSSARRAMPDGRVPIPGGWNRIHIVVEDLDAEVQRLREARLSFRNAIHKGRGGAQIILDDPSGNPVELFQPTQLRAELESNLNQSNDMTQKEGHLVSTISIRYMIDDVRTALDFYTTHLGFALEYDASPAFGSVTRDGVRLLLSGKTSSGRKAMPDGTEPVPGGWNRIHIVVEDLDAEVQRLREAGLTFRNEIIKGQGGSQIILDDPSGNPVELFQPSARYQLK